MSEPKPTYRTKTDPPTPTKAQLRAIIIEALAKLRQQYTVDGNLHRQFGADYPTALTAAKKLDLIEAAQQWLDTKLKR